MTTETKYVYGYHTLPEEGVWIKEGSLLIHVHRTDEGVVVDLWPFCWVADGPIASTYAFFSEGESDN